MENIAANEVDCTVNLGFDVTEAIGARADETPSHRYQHQLIDDHILKIRVGPNEIRTILLNLDEVEE